MNLSDYLKIAKEKHFAVPHFNFASAEQLKAIVLGFKNVLDSQGLPYGEYALMVGTSEGEAEFLGYEKARKLVDAWEEDTGLNIFLNADHHKSFELCKEAVDSGYDTVLIDSSALSFEENVRTAHRVVDYAKLISPQITVEGELGYLRGESKLQETVEIRPEDFTKPEEAKEFVEKTGVDRLAVAFGNIHGIVSKQEEKLDFDLLGRINRLVPGVFLVLHGGSGLSPRKSDFNLCIKSSSWEKHLNNLE